ncbi:hypothetical protein BT96DRAFT_988236 [Gymnopus androsaceus JB14]|uniref:MYND-type domain-containing protein n=1 Tax=Gymnopus androsaceus JB14 TaxID=1447944 RepID=A0A6A4I712_9AGAR|nr:hypothetical protein BT96DRAFT_988236 [Gymnopus androsaceus JB14]
MSIVPRDSPLRHLFGLLDAPDIETHPKEWWAAMDKHTAERFNPKNPLPNHFNRGQPESFYRDYITQDVIMEFVAARRITAHSQLNYSQIFVDLLAEQDFEEKFIALSPDEKENLFLRAFQSNEKRATYRPFLKGKADCPELNRDALFSDNGRGFVDVMRSCIISDISKVPAQPMIIENKRFDEIIGYYPNDTSTARGAQANMNRMMRTEYILTFVHCTVAFFHGVEQVEQRILTTEHSKTKPALKEKSAMFEELMGKAGSEVFKKEEAKRRKEMILHCQVCLKPEDKTKTGKMTVCSRCRAIGREIRYCGRECQVADWKSHKKECGKPLDISAAFADVNMKGSTPKQEGRVDIPPCPSGYRRSPHLIRHIEELQGHPSKDYLRDFQGDEYFGVSLDEVPGAAIFIVMRNILFTTDVGPRAEGALLYVYRVLQNSAPGGGEQGTQAQLKREYGLPLWNRMQELIRRSKPPYEIPEVSRAEIDVVLGWLQKSPRFEEELVAWRPGQGNALPLGLMVGPQKDVFCKAAFPESATPTPTFLTKMTNFRTMTGVRAVGPNFNIPKSIDEPENNYIYAKFTNLDDQIKYLQMNPQADYMIWGHPDSPRYPMVLQFNDFMTTVSFLAHRQHVFASGGYAIDSLVYLIMSLRPALKRKKIPSEVLLKQLGREYSRGYVDIALGMISRRESDGKEVYNRRNGKVYEIGEIPLKQTADTKKMLFWLKETGRFPDIFRCLPDSAFSSFTSTSQMALASEID